MTLLPKKPTIIRVFSRRSALDRSIAVLVPAGRSKFVSAITIAFLLLAGSISNSNAQSANFWSEQRKIPDYFAVAQQPPYMVADQNHTIHAFNSQPLDLEAEVSPKALYYRQWREESGWTYPNDIILDENGRDVEVLDVASDSSGVVYLIFQKDFQSIYFTYATLADAGKSTAWAASVQIAEESTHVSIGFESLASMAVDDNGNILVVYSGYQAGQGLYSVHSSDHGNNWSQPYPVYLTGDGSIVVTDPKLFVSKSGKAHVVWSTFMSDGSGGPGYYANFDLSTHTWNDPVPLDLTGIRTPSIVEHTDGLFISYYHYSNNGNWWRRSSDGGDTWTLPSRLSPRHVGTNGRVSFVLDSANTLHAFFGQRINDQNHGMWESIWRGGAWSTPESVVKGPQVRDMPGEFGFDPASARAIISNGNLVMVSWATDGFAGVNGAWYAYKRLNAPELPAVVDEGPTLPVSVLPTDTSVPLTGVATTNTPSVSLDELDRQPAGTLYNPQTSILAGAFMALALVSGVVLMRIFSQSKKP
jgi:hypothetical protein